MESVTCSVCSVPRQVSRKFAAEISSGKRKNVCRECTHKSRTGVPLLRRVHDDKVSIPCGKCGESRELTVDYYLHLERTGRNTCRACAAIETGEKLIGKPRKTKARKYVPGVLYHGWLLLSETEHRQKFLARHECGQECVIYGDGNLCRLRLCPKCQPYVPAPRARKAAPELRPCHCGRLESKKSASRGGVPECAPHARGRAVRLSKERGIFGRHSQNWNRPAVV